jgi:hypothetical protein
MATYRVTGKADVYLLDEAGTACGRTVVDVDFQPDFIASAHLARDLALVEVRRHFPGQYVCWHRIGPGDFDVQTEVVGE